MRSSSSDALEDRGASLIENLRDTLNQLAAQRGPIAVPDLRHVADEYLTNLKARTKPGYWQKVEPRLMSILLAAPTCGMREVETFRTGLLTRGLARTTANHYVAAARRFMKWASHPHRRLVRINELDELEDLEIEDADLKKRRGALTDEQIDDVLRISEAEDRFRHGVPQTPMWWTFLETALRWSELIRLERCDLEGNSLRIRCKTTKKGRAKRFPLDHVPEIVKLLREHLPFRSPRGKRLTSDSHNALRSLYRMLEKAGIPRCDEDGNSIDVHALRWTAATRMLRRGVPMKIVSELLGHISTELLERGVYVRLREDDHREALIKALKPTPLHSRASDQAHDQRPLA